MFLGNLLKTVGKKYKKIPIKGISFDTRNIKKGNIFFAISGIKTSGINFIRDAEKKGASAVVVDKKVKNKKIKIPLILVKDTRKSLSEACSNFYTKKPRVIVAVTGTNGKSSVADFFYQILKKHNISAASIGTLGIFSNKYKKKTSLTSIDPLSLHRSLEILAKNKVNHVILEASSHGLEQKRLNFLNIDVGIFTNLSHDHLDYHKNMKSYFRSKKYLFKNLLKKKAKIITDEDNKEFKKIKEIAYKKKMSLQTIGKNSGNIIILEHKYSQSKQRIKILLNSKTFSFTVPLIGDFQIKNLLMAILAANYCGLSIHKIIKQIHNIKSVSGRLECISQIKNNCKIIVDFAHTPKALEVSLLAIKKQFKKEIILVFGCGGERDKKKRYIMGKIAKTYCKKVFITDDNPRYENPKKIRNDIKKGCKKIAVEISNRKKAITAAIKEIKSNEILLIAGKGHEETQNYGNKTFKFSDKKVVKEIVKKNKLYYINPSKKVFKNNNINYNGVSINTKTIKKNNLFFAIQGKRNDGHKFVKEAIKKGAAKAIVSKKVKGVAKTKIIKVNNTFLSLNKFARTIRDNSTSKIIGITGSVGKTTLKNLVSFALKKYGTSYHSPHSYNNKFGVPLSISNLKNNIDYGIFEIGMDKKGEIDQLSSVVKPEIAVITNISEAHIKNFNTLKDIAKAKAEIINNITAGGDIVLNKDDKFFNFLSNEAKKKKININSFSTKNNNADVVLLEKKKLKKYCTIKLLIKNKVFFFNLNHYTENFISNILACISVLSVLDLNLKNLKNYFRNFSLPSGRGDVTIVKNFNKIFKFIDESYNANPLSMLSAIKNMDHYNKKNSGKKIIFLGDMLELGKKSKKLHKSLSIAINKSNIDTVYVYGKHIRETFNSIYLQKQGKVFTSLDKAYNHFSKILKNDDLFMVKGSNATGLNEFSKRIKKGK